MSTTIIPTETASAEVDLAKLFGSGRYSPLMCDIYKQSQVVFKLDETKAETLARAVATDFGAAMKDVEVKAKVSSKTSKYNQITCSEAAKQKFVNRTPALYAMQTLAWCAEAGSHGILWKNTSWEIGEKLAEYFESL